MLLHDLLTRNNERKKAEKCNQAEDFGLNFALTEQKNGNI